MTDPTNPRPVPKPGPKPGAKPGLKGVQPGGVSIPKNDPAKFGRVDADGVAWLKTADGERQIGEFKAGTPEEGLKHFGARYDDLSTEVQMLEARLKSHPEQAQTIRHDAKILQDSLSTAAVIGDIAALDARLEKISQRTQTAEKQVAEAKQERRDSALAQKEELLGEVEGIAAADPSTLNWKRSGERIRAIVEHWRSIKGVERSTDDELWKRFSKARSEFNRKRQAHFDELDRNRERARLKKEELIEQAEALQDSTEWGPTSAKYRDLMSQWKAAGRAPRNVDDQLWERFRKAQDVFFAARKADSAERDKEFEANADAKQTLIDEYSPKVDPQAHGVDKARKVLHELQEKWEQIGFVPRGRVREFEDKIKAIEARVEEAADAEWRRTDPEAQARVAQFQAKVDQFTREAETAEKAGNAAKAEKLRGQATQWQEWADAAAAALEG